MTLCSGITSGAINQNCVDQAGIISGAAETLLLYNFDELPKSAFTFDVTKTNQVTLITNPTGVQAYAFTGFRRTNKPSYEFVPGEARVGWNHIINFQINELTYEVKETINKMANGRFIGIVENLDRSADNTFEIYGFDVGLLLGEGSRNPDDIDTGAGFVLQLATGDTQSSEQLTPLQLFDTDYATTKAIFDGLTTPGV